VSRIASTDGDEIAVLPPRKMVAGYVDAVEVDTTGLDIKALKRLGRDIFASVEGQWRG